jgi:HAD superfamily hydrolase (TIGR01509 family)
MTEEASGIVFDLDGVLIDTEPIYLETINSILAGYGVEPLSASAYSEFIGKHADFTWSTLGARHGLPASPDELKATYDTRLEEILPTRLHLRPDAALLLAAVGRTAIKTAVATSSRQRWLDLKISVLGLGPFFGAVVSAEEVGKFKPEPDVFLVAAERAGIDPARAVAIEDSPSGITAAKRAGMRVFALRTESTMGLDLSEADEVIDSLDEIDLGVLFGARDGGHAPSVV